MERKYARVAAVTVAVLIALPFLVGALGIAHECSEENCPICVAIRNVFESARAYAIICAAGFVLSRVASNAAQRIDCVSVRTPVLARVRLND